MATGRGSIGEATTGALFGPARPSAATTTAEQQAAADPPAPTSRDGWSPVGIRAVRSRNEGGFIGSAARFSFGGVSERPGQRLSAAQVEQLAPFFATQFGLDEAYVRRELAKVYLYVGGPSTTTRQAMTIGHHVFVPDEASLQRILARPGRGWLAHELAHTMQFLAYQDGSPYRFLADYITGLAVGRDPREPGSGDGPPVWGAFFTGLRTAGRTEDAIGTGATTLRDRFVSSLLPAAAISLPVALTAGGALAAARATTGRALLGGGRSMPAALAVVAAPALGGALLGSAEQELGSGGAQALGAVAGGTVAGLALWRGGAFSSGANAVTGIGQALGRGTALGLAVGATLAGAAVGFVSATATANTMRGWSRSAEVLHSLRDHPAGEPPRRLSLQDAMHDAHWIEIDAEAIARRFTRGWTPPQPGSPPVAGRVPTPPAGLAQRIDADLSDRADWGLKLPLLVGIPAAVGVGAGVLATRTGVTLLRSTLQDGLGPGAAVRAALASLGSQHRGVGNSLGVGGAVTVAPLIIGGVVGPLGYSATGSETVARVGGAAASAATAGMLLTLLLRGNGASVASVGMKSTAGMAVAGAVGLLSASVATGALRPHERTYRGSTGGPRGR